MLIALLLTALLAQQPSPDDEAAREEALFGTEESRDPRDDALFGTEDPRSALPEHRLLEDLMARDDRLALGGRAFLRLDYAILDEGRAEDFALSSRNLFDLYLDGRPNDRVRVYLRGRLLFDPTVDPNASSLFGPGAGQRVSVALDQAWLKFDVARRVYVTFGQQPVRWGSSRFWNPTDFLNQQVLDPLAVFDQRFGVSMLELHVPIESLGWNFYTMATLDRASTPDSLGGGARAEILLGPAELALSFAKAKSSPWELGVDISSGLWLFEVRAETALLYDVRAPRYEGQYHPDDVFAAFLGGSLDPNDPFALYRVPPEKRWYVRSVLGLDITLRYGEEEGDTVTLGAEYFYNQLGYRDTSVYPVLLAAGAFQPLYLGEHYAALYGLVSGLGPRRDMSLIASVLSNLSDQSYLVRVDYRATVLTYLGLNVYAAYHFGRPGELNLAFTLPRSQVLQGVDPAVFGDSVDPALIALAQNGYRQVGPLVDVGLSVVVSF